MKDRKKEKERQEDKRKTGKEGKERGKAGRKKIAQEQTGQRKRLEELCNRRHVSAELGCIIMKIMLEYYLNVRRKCQHQM